MSNLITNKVDWWLNTEYEKEIKDKEKRKNEIISKLQTIYSFGKIKPHECEWILQAIEFIKEKNETAK